MQGEFCFALEGTIIRVGIIPTTPNSDLRHLGKLANELKRAIPFKFDIVIDPSVVTVKDTTRKRTLSGVEICVRPKTIDIPNAIGQLKAEQFIPRIASTYA